MGDLSLKLEDYRLTTAEIRYHSPNQPESLETLVWQSLDRLPDFPKLNSFLDAWKSDQEGQLHSVRVIYVGEVDLASPHCIGEQQTMH